MGGTRSDLRGLTALFCYRRARTGKSAGLLPVPDLGDRRAVEEVEEPVGGDAGPALGTLQLVEVGNAPEHGGHEAAELYPENLVDGELAPHLDELPQGLVLEGLEFSAVYGGQDVLRDGPSLLGGRLRVGRHRPSVLVDVGRAVADPPHVIVARDAHVGVHLQAPAFVVRET